MTVTWENIQREIREGWNKPWKGGEPIDEIVTAAQSLWKKWDDSSKESAAKGLGAYVGRRVDHFTNHHFEQGIEWIFIYFLAASIDSNVFHLSTFGTTALMVAFRQKWINPKKTKIDENLGKAREWIHKGTRLHYLLGGLVALQLMERIHFLRAIVPETLPTIASFGATFGTGAIAGHYLGQPVKNKK